MWTHDEILQNLSRNLKALRDRFDFLQMDVAAALGVTPSLMSRWESAERDPGLYGAYRIANYYGITLDELVANKTPDAAKAPTPPTFAKPETVDAARQYAVERAQQGKE